MKFLLFESHLFVYLQNHKEDFSKEKFIDSLYDFYSFHNGSSIPKLFQIFVKEQSKDKRIEKILEHRTEIKMHLLKQKWWVSSMNNTLSFLDVILFDEFLFIEDKEALKSYHDYARNAMLSVALSANSDGTLDKAERSIFTIFLASADLDDVTRKELKNFFMKEQILKTSLITV